MSELNTPSGDLEEPIKEPHGELFGGSDDARPEGTEVPFGIEFTIPRSPFSKTGPSDSIQTGTGTLIDNTYTDTLRDDEV